MKFIASPAYGVTPRVETSLRTPVTAESIGVASRGYSSGALSNTKQSASGSVALGAGLMGFSLASLQRQRRLHRAGTKPYIRVARNKVKCWGVTLPVTPELAHTKSQKHISLELIAILVIYFVQGSLSLARLAVTFRLKDELHLAPAQVAGLMGIINLPWILKPLYGFLSDALPIFGSHRRSYLVLSGLLGSISWIWLASVAATPSAIICGATVASLAVAMADVVADSIVVEQTRKAEEKGDTGLAADLQSKCWLANSVGCIAAAYFSGSLLETFSTQTVFGLTAVLPLLVSAVALPIKEARRLPTGKLTATTMPSVAAAGVAGTLQLSDVENTQLPLSRRLRLLWEAVCDRRVLFPSLVVFAILAKPSADVPFLYFLNNDLGFGKEMLGRLKLAEAVATFAGVVVYQRFLKNVSTRKIFLGTTLAFIPAGLLQMILVSKIHRSWGIPDAWLAFGDDVALSALGQIAFMPTLVIAARLCPPGVEGALFATLMSVDNAARILGQETGSVLTRLLGITESDFTKLPVLLAISTFYPLVVLPLLKIFDSVDGGQQSSQQLGQKPKSDLDLAN